MKKRIISFLLCVVMLIGVMPMGLFTVTAGALTDPPTGTGYPTVKVKNWDELKAALENDGNAIITLTDDIHYYIGLSGKNTPAAEPIKCTIYGNKILELNGNDIYYEDDSNAYTVDKGKWSKADRCYTTLFSVDKNADLTIQDSKGGGKIHSSAYFIGYQKCCTGKGEFFTNLTDAWLADYVDMYTIYCTRNLFEIDGTVTMKSGTVAAGKEKKQWVTEARLGDSDLRTGYVTQGIAGNAFTVNDGGTLTVFGGEISGTACVNYSWWDKGVASDSAVDAKENSHVTIYDGKFIGYNGANTLKYKYKATCPDITVYGGIFETRKNDYFRETDRNRESIRETKSLDVQVEEGVYGRTIIPASAIKDSNTRLISHGVDVTNDTIKNGSYLSDKDVTVTCGGMGDIPEPSIDLTYQEDEEEGYTP